MREIAGIFAPIIIPFNEDESLDREGLRLNLKKWMNSPLDGVVIPGSNSEAAYLTPEERIELMTICAEEVKAAGKILIGGSGMETTRQTVLLTQEAERLGADAVLVIPPYFYKPAMNHQVLVEHYSTLAAETNVPILLYNVPNFTGVAFGTPTILELSKNLRIVGMKDSSNNLVQMTEVRALAPDFQIFAGTGSALLGFMSIGALGGIMAQANFAAKPLRALYDSFLAGDQEEARRIQLLLAPLNTAVTGAYGVPGLKYVCEKLGFKAGHCRKPLLPINAEAKGKLDALIDRCAEIL